MWEKQAWHVVCVFLGAGSRPLGGGGGGMCPEAAEFTTEWVYGDCAKINRSGLEQCAPNPRPNFAKHATQLLRIFKFFHAPTFKSCWCLWLPLDSLFIMISSLRAFWVFPYDLHVKILPNLVIGMVRLLLGQLNEVPVAGTWPLLLAVERFEPAGFTTSLRFCWLFSFHVRCVAHTSPLPVRAAFFSVRIGAAQSLRHRHTPTN